MSAKRTDTSGRNSGRQYWRSQVRVRGRAEWEGIQRILFRLSFEMSAGQYIHRTPNIGPIQPAEITKPDIFCDVEKSIQRAKIFTLQLNLLNKDNDEIKGLKMSALTLCTQAKCPKSLKGADLIRWQ